MKTKNLIVLKFVLISKYHGGMNKLWISENKQSVKWEICSVKNKCGKKDRVQNTVRKFEPKPKAGLMKNVIA